MKVPKPKFTLRTFNNLLSIMVVFLSLYIILLPFLPSIGFWWDTRFGTEPALVAANEDSKPDKPQEVIPDKNTLVIPSMRAQLEIFEGPDERALNQGIWRRPHTSSPDKGGNTVIVGHRFTYTEPNGPFYHLDKVKPGDKIVVYWNKQKYIYRVDTISVVPPTQTEIEEPTDEPRLTLYTCTPLWSAKDRLVVVAKPEEQTP